MEAPGLWWAGSPVCLQEQTEQPLSMVSPALAGRVGPGPGADGSSAGLGRDFELGVAGQVSASVVPKSYPHIPAAHPIPCPLTSPRRW